MENEDFNEILIKFPYLENFLKIFWKFFKMEMAS